MQKKYNNVNTNIGDDYMFKVENKVKNANIARTIRFTEELFENLNKVASENDVSLNRLVLQCCNYALENMKEKDENKQ